MFSWPCRICPHVTVRQSVVSPFFSTDLQPTSTTATTQHCIPGTTNVQSPSSSGEFFGWIPLCSHHGRSWPRQASLSASSPMGKPADHDELMAQLVAQGLPPHCSPLPAVPSRGCALPALPCFIQASYPYASAFLVLQMLQPCWRQWGSWGSIPGQVLLTSKDQPDHADLWQGEKYWALLSIC